MLNKQFMLAAMISLVAHVAGGVSLLAAVRAPATVQFKTSPGIELSLVAGIEEANGIAPARQRVLTAVEKKTSKLFEEKTKSNFSVLTANISAPLNTMSDLTEPGEPAFSHSERGQSPAVKQPAAFASNPSGKAVMTPTDVSIVPIAPLCNEHAPPEYPMTARFKGQEGVVLLSAEVLKDGTVGQLHVTKSSGYALLDRSALDSVRKWKFNPGRKLGAPATMWVDVPIRFALHD